MQLCGDSEVVGKWINRKYFLGQMYQAKVGRIQKNIAPIVEKEDYQTFLEMKHIVREHNREADHSAN